MKARGSLVEFGWWVIGFVVVAPVLLLMLAAEWAFGWMEVEGPERKE